jgi:CheY-like chemotaxis protein
MANDMHIARASVDRQVSSVAPFRGNRPLNERRSPLMATILVVEDSESNAQLVQSALEIRGYEVVCVRTGEDGLDAARTLIPDLILMDLRLPDGLDGWETIRRIRLDPNLRHTPIIVTSVEILPDDRQRAYDAGCDVYYPKPFDIGELRQRILEYIGPAQ